MIISGKLTKRVRRATCVGLIVIVGGTVRGDLQPGIDYHPSRILVQFKPGSTAPVVAGAHAQVPGAAVIAEFHVFEGLQLVQVPEGQVFATAAAYAANPDVLYAGPDYIYRLDDVPNDTQRNRQWGMNNVGDTIEDCDPPCGCVTLSENHPLHQLSGLAG